ncbi:CerR family C-terminal domain-containing protein [uncultured Sphingomonas sp.]|uniref:CerR family C-terminal domain-containing protein n=1 Tax=uncultured Sphingomonas sp. TaxID=158754 RepID=UPI0035CB15DF
MIQQRLLDVAVREFGAKGLDGASTRSIAAQAGAAMSSITYHYGSKEGLYLAAADYVAGQLGGVADDDRLGAAIEAGDSAEARRCVHLLLGGLLARMFEGQADNWALFIMREQMNPTEAFERIYAGPMGRNADALVDLICVVAGTKDRRAAQLAAIALFGQVLIVKAGRATCHKILERETLGRDIIQSYSDHVAANTDTILDRMIAEREEQA